MYFTFLGDLLFPSACLECSIGLDSGVLCESCEKNIDIFQTLFCGSCNARLPDAKKICHKDFPYILGTAARYDDAPVQKLVQALKFQGLHAAATPLAALLIRYVIQLHIDISTFCVVPIPLSNKRRRSRGFNQAVLVAKPFARQFNIPIVENILARTLHKKPQSETSDLSERMENVRDCFSLCNPSAAENKKIILIDDVTTSGTTFTEAAKVLKAGGAKRILALAIAQA